MSHTSRNHLTCDNHAMHTRPRIHYCNKKFFRGLRKVKTRRGWHSSVSLLPCHHCQADKSLCTETRPSLRNSWKTCQSSSTRGDVSSRSRQMADADPTWKEQGKRSVSRIDMRFFVYPSSIINLMGNYLCQLRSFVNIGVTNNKSLCVASSLCPLTINAD